ncbi:methylmalonyl-CoA mutase family protein [Marinihelvus fidelis]|uniref:Fused isobutyryl-CoA mutase n=1 Tax=Marinihelvus fidelis TaxID=2613842 RepID=A0A5N0THI4_9GAMM|nr:methylmalonyl-CoA mutase family protein [Marinihelvus fidelis]KAA9134051.1 methylmalonyl-CoA mutase family protein [Marinihelvus fidelis]
MSRPASELETGKHDGDAARQGAHDTPLRFVTAASLFDGHDAAINIMRRLIQAQGCEVIHLGHNRSVLDIVRAAIQEDADAIAISSYQGGHNEYFRFMIDQLRERGAGHIKVFGGGGGTITLDEIAELEAYGVERIYHPDDGMGLGLVEMIEDVVERAGRDRVDPEDPEKLRRENANDVAAVLSMIEEERYGDAELKMKRHEWAGAAKQAPVIGITGTGGAGKSSVTDEILNRFLACFPGKNVAVLAVDPTRRRTGGALLGDRIRMNSLRSEHVYMRSMATRRQHLATSKMLKDAVDFLKSAGFDLVIVETAGIGQSDSEIVDLVDFPVYVMTSEFGAQSQLEKIDMLDFAELVILNKFDKRGAEDALRDVRKQWKRNHLKFDLADEQVPVYPTIASQFNDPGVTWMFANLARLLQEKLDLPKDEWTANLDTRVKEPKATVLIPPARTRYLAEIAEQGRAINENIERQAETAHLAQSYHDALGALEDCTRPAPFERYTAEQLKQEGEDASLLTLRQKYDAAIGELSEEALQLLRTWPERKEGIRTEQYEYQVRGKTITGNNYRESLSHLQIPKIGMPRDADWGELLSFLMRENLPGGYPYTAGVFPYRRTGEDPTRMFAGEGTPERTNRRFHYVSKGQPAARLSTAFDSVTLYGEDPAIRPDIYGKVGNSGVSIATLDDMKKLYSGFDLCAPTTSVSMTINGPAPMILAFFMNAAVDQQVEKYLKEGGRWEEAEKTIDAYFQDRERPKYHGDLPEGNDGLGLGLLGITGDKLVDADTYAKIKKDTLSKVRGTVQADILKEDQAQNTCIFSTEFAMRMMGDIQQYFVDHNVRNFYSVSISGYHIAEAGANPISQLAFTLSNGFTIVEYYLARGMAIDDFAPNLSFFFSNGMDPEYTVIGRVARRIWARAMRERYGANTRSQMLKYHIQTSGRSLHAQEIQFNDIRTTLQALYALFDNCNSLHTNAYDEAITTPTEESVRRAVAIQMIISKELGLNYCENPWQGSFIVDELTDLVEEAVYQEFERLSERGGVLGAMDTMYQRSKIQEESLYYEHKKHDGSLPLIGVNTFLGGKDPHAEGGELELMRSTDAEKDQQVENVETYRSAHGDESGALLRELQDVARKRENTFEALMAAGKVCSLGSMSHALYEVGGEYRRNM